MQRARDEVTKSCCFMHGPVGDFSRPVEVTVISTPLAAYSLESRRISFEVLKLVVFRDQREQLQFQEPKVCASCKHSQEASRVLSKFLREQVARLLCMILGFSETRIEYRSPGAA